MGTVRSIENLNLNGKRVLVRVDFNVPVKNGKVEDDFRIRAAVPTMKRVLDQGGSLVLMTHLGRPKGKGVEAEFTLDPVAKTLEGIIGRPVKKLNETVGATASATCKALKPGEIVLLENLRFNDGEQPSKDGKTDKQEVLGKQLAELADVYISDAFGTAHRADTSMTIPAKYLPTAAGYLMLAELKYLGGLLENPAKPFMAVIGGAKVSDKLPILKNLAPRLTTLVIGGGMAFTFLKAQGIEIGKSLLEADLVDTAKQILADCKAKNVEVVLPIDHVVASVFDAPSGEVCNGAAVPADKMGLDVGPLTIKKVIERVNAAKTILFNGALGVFEKPQFAKGTQQVLEAIAASKATSVVGGGDAANAAKMFNVAAKLTHVSTGGGASLEFLSGDKLPGVAALEAAAARG